MFHPIIVKRITHLLVVLLYFVLCANISIAPVYAEIFSDTLSVQQVITYKDISRPERSSVGADFVPTENAFIIAGKISTGEFYSSNTIGIVKEKEHTNLALWKYYKDGTLDTSFGYGGITTIEQGYASFIEKQSNRKLIIAGITYTVDNNTVHKTAHIYRYAPYGLIDNSFGNIGTFTFTDVPITQFASIQVLNDDSILIMGYVPGNPNTYIIKLTSDGALDSTFGIDGYIEVQNTYNHFSIDSNNNMYLVGSEPDIIGYTTYYDTAIRKFNQSGSPDLTYGIDGKVIITEIRSANDLSSNTGKRVYIDGNDIIIAGEVVFNDTSKHIFISKLVNGTTLDTNFGSKQGFSVFNRSDSPIYSSFVKDLQKSSSGDYIVSGNSSSTFESTEIGNNFFFAQFNEAGVLDSGFNEYGYYRFPISSSGEAIIQNDPKDYFVAGFQTIDNVSYLSVWNIQIQPIRVMGGSPIVFSSFFKPDTTLVQSIQLSNATEEALSIPSLSLAGPFAIQADSCSLTILLPSEGCLLSVSFDIVAIGTFSGSISFNLTGFPTQKIELVASIADESIVYRFFNLHSGAHLYTISPTERDTVMNLTDEWQYEGEKFSVLSNQLDNTLPVYRFFNTQNGAHLYTISEHERQTIIDTLPFMQFEGVKFYVYDDFQANTLPIYRFFNTQNGAHLYTISEHEKQTILDTLPYMQYEGIKYFVNP